MQLTIKAVLYIAAIRFQLQKKTDVFVLRRLQVLFYIAHILSQVASTTESILFCESAHIYAKIMDATDH